MVIPQTQINAFQKEILHWYKSHQRDLPWRHPSLVLQKGLRDPYKILVSEVMLQQTQVQRVIPKYENWLKVFPSLDTLAKASIRDVLFHWSGLGYNRRALYLQKFALEIVRKFDGQIPQDETILRSLPGIGEYTARALLCFAFDVQVAVVDTNVRKVIAVRFFKGKLPDENIIQKIAQELLPKGKAYEWNQALMDYASEMLKEYKIPIPKQSKFQESDRFFRGLIIRLFLKNHALSYAKLVKEIRQLKPIELTRLEKILEHMQKERLLIKENGKFTLPQ